MFTALVNWWCLPPPPPAPLPSSRPPTRRSTRWYPSLFSTWSYNPRTISYHHPQEDLLLLLLGAAVQSEQKQVNIINLKIMKIIFAHYTVGEWVKFQDIVIGIKNLPLDTQHGIVDRIRAVWCTFLFSRRLICCPQVTEDPAIVWNKALNDPGSLGEHQRDDLYTVLVEHTNRLSIHSKSFPKNIAVPAFLPTHKNLRKGNFF